MIIKNEFKAGIRALSILLLCLLFLPKVFASGAVDPSSPDYTGRKWKNIFVSKLGDNSDGGSWEKAFNSIQAALSAIPDEKGGHTIIIRPDTYVEANLSTAFKGAKESYNLLIGDSDGRLGSGATGRIIIDSGDPEKGFKSYDWWGTIRATTKGKVQAYVQFSQPVTEGFERINLWPDQLFDFMAIPKPN